VFISLKIEKNWPLLADHQADVRGPLVEG